MNLDGHVIALQSRDYHSDFFYLTIGSSVIRNHRYISDSVAPLDLDYVGGPIMERALDYTGVTPASMIVTPKNICLVDKNKLLVYGLSIFNDSVFELH